MLGNLYTMEKIRELESQIEAARRRHTMPATGIADLVGPVAGWPGAALSRLARRGRRLSGTESALAGPAVLDAVLGGRGQR